jgi:hypothetical protein
LFLCLVLLEKNIFSFNIEDLHNVRLIRSLFLSAVDAADFMASLAKSLLDGNLGHGLEEVLGTLEGGHLETDNTTGHVQLTDDGVADRDGEDGDTGAILGDQTRQLARVGEDDDQINVKVVDAADSGSGDSLGRGDGG